jgi:hypothetical protein
MTDSARQFIDDTMTQLVTWRPEFEDRYSVGRKHFHNQKSAPWIWWAYGSVDHDSVENHGWTDKEIASEEQTLIIKIWGGSSDDDEEFCRVAKNDLLRALRVAGDGPNLNYGSFDWVSEDEDKAGYSTHGAMLLGTVIVKLPVKADPSTLPTPFASITGAELEVITEHPDDELQQTIIIPQA